MAGVKEKIESNLKLIKSMVEGFERDIDIAKKIDVSYASYKSYKAKDLALKAIYEEIKNKRNEEVEGKLFKLCTGYDYTEEMAFKCKEEEITEGGKILVKESVRVVKVKKRKDPDLNAQKYWLNNKKKAIWKDDPHKVELGKKTLKIKQQQVEEGIL